MRRGKKKKVIDQLAGTHRAPQHANTHQIWKPHVPFIMFYCGILRGAKPSLISSREIQGITPTSTDRVHCRQTFFFYLSIFTLSVAGRLPIWCSSPVVGLTFQHLQSDLLRFPFPSWIADTEHRISLNSSPVKSRKTSAINHSPSSFRFRWGNATRTKSGAKPFNPNSKWV